VSRNIRLHLEDITESCTKILNYTSGMDFEALLADDQSARKEVNHPSIKTQFISTEPVSVTQLLQLFENVELTPEEEVVYQALHTIEPKCERIAGKTTHNRFENGKKSSVTFNSPQLSIASEHAIEVR
jgi:hypothetical protein